MSIDTTKPAPTFAFYTFFDDDGCECQSANVKRPMIICTSEESHRIYAEQSRPAVVAFVEAFGKWRTSVQFTVDWNEWLNKGPYDLDDEDDFAAVAMLEMARGERPMPQEDTP